MSFDSEVKGAKKVLEAINKDGPRNEDGELKLPYRTWAKHLGGWIAKAEDWKRTIASAQVRKQEAP